MLGSLFGCSKFQNQAWIKAHIPSIALGLKINSVKLPLVGVSVPRMMCTGSRLAIFDQLFPPLSFDEGEAHRVLRSNHRVIERLQDMRKTNSYPSPYCGGTAGLSYLKSGHPYIRPSVEHHLAHSLQRRAHSS